MNRKDNLFFILLPSILGICLCTICLFGGTYAWFIDSQRTGIQNIQTADFYVSVVINQEMTEIPLENGMYSLGVGQYSVSLTAGGDATTGYCVFVFNGKEVFTEQIAKGNEITFTLSINKETKLKVVPVWGTYTGICEIQNGELYVYEQAVQQDLVQEEDVNESFDVMETIEETVPPTVPPTATPEVVEETKVPIEDFPEFGEETAEPTATPTEMPAEPKEETVTPTMAPTETPHPVEGTVVPAEVPTAPPVVPSTETTEPAITSIPEDNAHIPEIIKE